MKKPISKNQFQGKIVILLFLLFIAFGLDAQPTGPTGSPTPFGFVEALIIAGAAYGGKTLITKNKQTRTGA